VNGLVLKILAGLARHGLTMLGGYLVSAGWLTADQSTQAIGAVVALAGIAWSAYEKHQGHQLITAQAKSITALHAALQGSASQGTPQ
jgi:hypothetical protein